MTSGADRIIVPGCAQFPPTESHPIEIKAEKFTSRTYNLRVGEVLNVFPIWKDRLSVESIVSTPKPDLIYGIGYLDLQKDGPTVIEVLMEQTRIYSLAREDNPPAMIFPNGTGQPTNMLYPQDYSYFEGLADFVNWELISVIRNPQLV